MSKIKSVWYRDNFVSISLESGVSSSFYWVVDKSVVDLIGSFIVGIEIFDQKSIDDVLKSFSCDRDFTFGFSNFILKLGSLEQDVSVFDYIGLDCDFVSVSDFYTVSDFLEFVNGSWKCIVLDDGNLLFGAK